VKLYPRSFFAKHYRSIDGGLMRGEVITIRASAAELHQSQP